MMRVRITAFVTVKYPDGQDHTEDLSVQWSTGDAEHAVDVTDMVSRYVSALEAEGFNVDGNVGIQVQGEGTVE